MTKKELLQDLNFGAVDSESESNLDKIFIQTKNFNEFINPDVALLLGSKGAGKSALYRLFAKYESTARGMASRAIDNTYIVAGIGFKDLPEMDDMQLLNQLEDRVISPESAWKIYIAYKIIHILYTNYKIICGSKSRRVLQRSHEIKDYRISSVLSSIYERIVGEPPQIDQIDFKDVAISLGKRSRVSVYDLLDEINTYLDQQGKTVWFLLDKIDELFPSKSDVRKECIEGLFLAYIDFVSRYNNIKIKIFLRTDIWNTLSFVNKSHLTDKTTIIRWEEPTLKQLLIKRAINNPKVHDYIFAKLGSKDWENHINTCFDVLFPERVYSGKREARTMAWMIERCKDGLDGVYPREIINFANYANGEEIKNTDGLEQDEFVGGESLISGSSIREAFKYVSQVKVKSYLSEFEYLSKHFERFSGLQNAEFSQSELIALMEGLLPEGEDMIHALHETGILAYNSGQTLTKDSKLVVPRLFRSGLGIVTLGRP